MSDPTPQPAADNGTTSELSDDELNAASGGVAFDAGAPDAPTVGAVIF